MAITIMGKDYLSLQKHIVVYQEYDSDEVECFVFKDYDDAKALYNKVVNEGVQRAFLADVNEVN